MAASGAFNRRERGGLVADATESDAPLLNSLLRIVLLLAVSLIAMTV